MLIKHSEKKKYYTLEGHDKRAKVAFNMIFIVGRKILFSSFFFLYVGLLYLSLKFFFKHVLTCECSGFVLVNRTTPHDALLFYFLLIFQKYSNYNYIFYFSLTFFNMHAHVYTELILLINAESCH